MGLSCQFHKIDRIIPEFKKKLTPYQLKIGQLLLTIPNGSSKETAKF